MFKIGRSRALASAFSAPKVCFPPYAVRSDLVGRAPESDTDSETPPRSALRFGSPAPLSNGER